MGLINSLPVPAPRCRSMPVSFAHVQAVAHCCGPLLALPDDQILAHATATGRALVTANIKDFIPLDAQYRAAGQNHAGLIFISSKTFRQDRAYTAAITGALSAFLDQDPGLQPGQVTFLPRQ